MYSGLFWCRGFQIKGFMKDGFSAENTGNKILYNGYKKSEAIGFAFDSYRLFLYGLFGILFACIENIDNGIR